MMRWISWASLQHLLPQKLISNLIYHIARSSNPIIKNALIAWFIKQYPINLNEAAQSDPKKYKTFNGFFTRKLKPQARAITGNEETIVCPVDGRLTEFGAIKHGQLIQAKAIEYPLDALLGEKATMTQPFLGGYFATFYLAPENYHRIHIPIAAVSMGARLVEKHVTLNKKMNGTDHAASIDMDELSEMVKCIREVEVAFGSSEKRKFESENPLINVLGKSLVTTQDIQSGVVIDESMLTTKGPFEGIPASEYYNVIGKKLKNEKKADQILFIEDFD